MRRGLKIKVCGMRDPGNIREVAGLGPDYMGFIFYPGSRRFFSEAYPLPEMDQGIRKTAVFVDEDPEEMLRICRAMDLSAIQLHGNEPPDTCRLLRDEGFEILKAINISGKRDFDVTAEYLGGVDYFLFDTGRRSGAGRSGGTGTDADLRGITGKDPDLSDDDETDPDMHGGTGRQFDWGLLDNFQQEVPFFLSGGIGPGDMDRILAIGHPAFYGVDLNSGFEDSPGLKNKDLLERFILKLRKHQTE